MAFSSRLNFIRCLAGNIVRNSNSNLVEFGLTFGVWFLSCLCWVCFKYRAEFCLELALTSVSACRNQSRVKFYKKKGFPNFVRNIYSSGWACFEISLSLDSVLFYNAFGLILVFTPTLVWKLIGVRREMEKQLLSVQNKYGFSSYGWELISRRLSHCFELFFVWLWIE